MSLEDHFAGGNGPSRKFGHWHEPRTSLTRGQLSQQGRPFRVEATWGAMTAKRRWAIGRHGGKSAGAEVLFSIRLGKATAMKAGTAIQDPEGFLRHLPYREAWRAP
jgi:hypothetical protein